MLASLALVAATSSTTIWKYDNPFCGVVARVAPIADGTGYAVALDASAGNTVDAHVTLVGASDAYDADLTGQPLVGTPDDRHSDGVIVKLPNSAKIAYFFVDSYAIDGGKSVSCPSYVFPVSTATLNVPPGVSGIAAQHLQALGSLPCGHVYVPPSMHGQFQSAIGKYGNRRLTVVARAYIDSNGRSVREELLTSSGVEGVDQFELGAIREHQFMPAQFLCTPVVSTIDVEMHYSP